MDATTARDRSRAWFSHLARIAAGAGRREGRAAGAGVGGVAAAILALLLALPVLAISLLLALVVVASGAVVLLAAALWRSLGGLRDRVRRGGDGQGRINVRVMRR
jgi:hypothetical protein